MTDDPPLILLSGMTTDDRLFHFQKRAFPSLTVPAWIEPKPDEGLASYAERLALIVDPGIPCFIGGASFGGMVALEMSRHLQAIGCFLIASIRSSNELPWNLRACRPLTWLGRRRGDRLPAANPRLLRPFLSAAAWRQIGKYSQPDAAFLRWASLAVLSWHPSGDWNVPIYQIHGDRDRTLPCNCTQADVVVPGGDHMLPFTSPHEVNNFLRDRIGRHASMVGNPAEQV
jgi:pimeloyl-ACP methyl ester carboxylesterase